MVLDKINLNNQNMKKFALTICALAIVALSFGQKASDVKIDKSKLQFNAGVGLSTWGIPLYIGADYWITPEITVGLEASLRYRVLHGYGAIMAANVLNSPEAVRMSVFVVRAFVQMRDLLGSTKELAKQLAALEKKLTDRLDGHESAIIEVLRRVMDILDPPPPPPGPETPKRRIGFNADKDEKPVANARKKA